MMQTVAQSKAETELVGRLMGYCLAVVTLGVFIATVLGVVHHLRELEAHALISLLLLPAWLTIGALPFLYMGRCSLATKQSS